MAAQQLPVANLMAYDDLKRPSSNDSAVTLSVELGDNSRPFVMAQQLPLQSRVLDMLTEATCIIRPNRCIAKCTTGPANNVGESATCQELV